MRQLNRNGLDPGELLLKELTLRSYKTTCVLGGDQPIAKKKVQSFEVVSPRP